MVGLSKRINELFSTDKELAGIVVTSGTDTEETVFLHLTVRDPRPVVIVGSMRNPSTVGYEGAANLLEGSRGGGSGITQHMLVLNDDQLGPQRTKTDALRLQTFRAANTDNSGSSIAIASFTSASAEAQRAARARHRRRRNCREWT
jgi:L-asparaginase/Glu-tRNA(Gln) amidotransferase subunit D